MRYALFSDIHGNLQALEACLAHMKSAAIDKYLCLGDIVGYGADVQPCLQIVRKMGCDTIAGNHDWAATGKLDVDGFNMPARLATIYSREQLSKNDVAWLDALPLTRTYGDFMVSHGTIHQPESFHYIQTIQDAMESFDALKGKAWLGFLGHSHVPVTFFGTDPISYNLDQVIPLDKAIPTIVNIGSVGQPRDEDPRASYAVYDSARCEVTIHRVPYDIKAAAARIQGAGLPRVLGERLFSGK
jgi:diadenosine tetraphosphatase ApaH/serine/threonine PP2A family protein phosphatase